MEIVKVSKKKKNVILYFESEKITVPSDVYLKFKFKKGDFIDEEKKKQIFNEIESFKIRKYACKLINNKLYCKKELSFKVFKKFGDSENVVNSLNDILQLSIFSEEKYVRYYLDYFNDNNYGKYYILNFFNTREIDKTLIESIEFLNNDEIAKAKRYIELNGNKLSSGNYAKKRKKIFYLLNKRGFEYEVIYEFLENLKIDKDKEYKQLSKDYMKLYNKLNEKESNDKRAKNKIVNKLIMKGYSYEDVLNFIEKRDLDD